MFNKNSAELLGLPSHSERAHGCCLNGGFVWEVQILGPSPPPSHLGPFFQRMASRTGAAVAPAAMGRKAVYEDERVGVRTTERGGKKHPNWREDGDDIPSLAEGGAGLPNALLLASLASSGSSLLRSEHASTARGTSSAAPGQQVPDQELRREPSSFFAPPTGPEPQSCDHQPRLPKGVGTFLFRRRSPRGNTDRT